MMSLDETNFLKKMSSNGCHLPKDIIYHGYQGYRFSEKMQPVPMGIIAPGSVHASVMAERGF
jgi:hypothetical protein